jgi:hypothetical protein
MLKQADKDKIKAYGFDVDKLIEAVKADAEVEYAVPEFVAIKQTDLEARDANKVAEGKRAGETAGETKGKELAAKAFKKKFNLAETIPNDPDKVVEAVNEQLGKGDAGLKEQIALLQKDKEKALADYTAAEARAKQVENDNALINQFPAKRSAGLSDAERLMIVKANLAFDTVDGKAVVKRNGEIMRDKTTQNPISPQQALTDYFTERKWLDAGGAGGRGGGDDPGGGGGTAGVKKMSEFQNKWLVENPGGNVNSAEFINAMNTHAKDHKDFNFYE